MLRRYGGEVRDNHGEGQRQTGRATHPVQQATRLKYRARGCDPNRGTTDHSTKPDKDNALFACV
ncbi:MAG: hypothetical protein IJU81_05515 [Bacteroidales bacterium]|nr:hypothetical protein [Bacteroidales bacterium]